MARVREVEYEFAVRVITDETTVDTRAVLAYETDQPLQVSLFTDASRDEVDNGNQEAWIFARDLLVFAVAGPVGIGDVRVDRQDTSCIVRLSSPDGTANIVFRWDDVLSFITATASLVPLGHEHVGVPDDLSELFDL